MSREVVVAPRRGAVLIVDDEPAVGVILGRVLRDHDVRLLTRAREAVDLIVVGKHFDVIISDLMMPDMSGIELYNELVRRQPDAAQRRSSSAAACSPRARARSSTASPTNARLGSARFVARSDAATPRVSAV